MAGDKIYSSQMTSNKPHILLFDIAFYAYIFCFAIGQSDALVLVKLTSPLLLASKLFSVAAFLSHNYNKIYRLLLFFIVIAIAQYLKIEYEYEVVAKCLLIFAAFDITIEHVLKVSFYSILSSLIFILTTIILGLNTDFIMNRGFAVKGFTAHTFGFHHYSNFSFRVVGLTFLYIFLNRKSLTTFKIFILILINVAVMWFSITRLHLICSFLFILFAIVIYKFRVNFANYKFFKYSAFVFFPAVALFYIALGTYSILTTTNIFDWWDDSFSGRMFFTLQAFDSYGITPWGNLIEMIGSRSALAGRGVENFYIDSGYAYWILAYGYVFTSFIILAYSYILYKCYLSKEFFLYIVTLICCISNMINDFFNFIEAFPILFLVFAKFKSYKGIEPDIIAKIIRNQSSKQIKRINHNNCSLSYV